MKSLCYFLGVFLLFTFPHTQQDPYARQREEMVNKQLAARGITHRPTLEAMRKVERHRLVPEEMRKSAYEDGPLPIGEGQTISQPYMVAFMTQAVKPEEDMKVLEIGTGSGYQAAVLAEIVGEVYTIETVDSLAVKARRNLEKMGYDNIHYKVGDGFYGWEEHAPFDAIVVTAAPEEIPPMLLEQLKPGGKMVIPVGSVYTVQNLRLVEKNRKGKVRTRELMPVRFVPFTRREN